LSDLTNLPWILSLWSAKLFRTEYLKYIKLNIYLTYFHYRLLFFSKYNWTFSALYSLDNLLDERYNKFSKCYSSISFFWRIVSVCISFYSNYLVYSIRSSKLDGIPYVKKYFPKFYLTSSYLFSNLLGLRCSYLIGLI